jgi:hypothetical protein
MYPVYDRRGFTTAKRGAVRRRHDFFFGRAAW